MKIKNIMVTFWFNKITDIKNKINYFEDDLSEYFHGINSIGVSADIDPLYPRLTATSDGGHTKLTVSMINLQITTSFDNEYNLDYSKCFKYIKERITKIYNLFSKTLKIDILYGAILVLCEIEEKNPMNVIKKNLLSEKLNGNYCESGVKIAEITDDKFYKNFSFNTTKEITIKKMLDNSQKEVIIPLISLRDATIEKESIIINYEINDKYSFDTKSNYNLNLDSLNTMLNIAQKDISIEITKKIKQK